MVQVICNVAMSLDGFIAPPDGRSDWLDPYMRSGEDYGLAAFMASVGAVLMGSRTYEPVMAQGGANPASPSTPTYVFSSRALPAAGPHVSITSASPAEVVAELERRGIGRAWLMGGARLAASFRAAGLIDEYALGIIPVVLGAGAPLFESPGPADRLDLVESKVHPSGVIQARYRVVRDD